MHARSKLFNGLKFVIVEKSATEVFSDVPDTARVGTNVTDTWTEVSMSSNGTVL